MGNRECLAGDAMVCPAVAAALALEELDRLKAIDRLPEPEALLERLRGRSRDFDLLAGAAGAYLHEREFLGGCE